MIMIFMIYADSIITNLNLLNNLRFINAEECDLPAGRQAQGMGIVIIQLIS
jgi:hypothetical protein